MRGKLFCIAAAVVLVAAIGTVQAEVIQVETRYSGSNTDTAIDTDGDGTTANSYILGAKGTGGEQTITGIFELTTDTTSIVCSPGLIAFETVNSTYVVRYPNGDLLFATTLPGGGGCFDPGTGVGRGYARYVVLGGTGKYQGASGTLDDYNTIVALAPGVNPLNPVAFGALFGTQTGTIVTVGD